MIRGNFFRILPNDVSYLRVDSLIPRFSSSARHDFMCLWNVLKVQVVLVLSKTFVSSNYFTRMILSSAKCDWCLPASVYISQSFCYLFISVIITALFLLQRMAELHSCEPVTKVIPMWYNHSSQLGPK